MIEFSNINNYIDEKYSVFIRAKDYDVKIPNLRDWLFITSLDFTKLDRNFRDKVKCITDIMIPDLNINDLTNMELLDIVSKCFNILSRKKEETSKDEEQQEESTDSVYMNFDYLMAKYCRYTNSSPKEALETNIFVFLGVLNGIDSLIAEETLRMAEIFDNHLHLKSKDGSFNYKKTLDKYRDSFKKGVNVVAGIDTNKLNSLKEMLKRGI